jgi:hypothetical protein
MLYPTRCQHLKVNGTQCGSPSLRRKTLCYFHHRNHEEQMHLQIDRRRRITVTMPPLEDANAIQISLTQVTRMLLSGAIDQRTAGLLLYSLQIASSNLARTSFEPGNKNDVVIHPSQAATSRLQSHLWEDEDFNGIEEQEKENQQFPEIPDEKMFVNQDENQDENQPEAKQEGQPQAETGPPPKIPPHSVSLNSLREMVFEHIVNAIPNIMEGLEKEGAEMFKE